MLKYLLIFLPLGAIQFEIPCVLIQDFATHRIYLVVQGCEYDIFEIEHSVNCDCLGD